MNYFKFTETWSGTRSENRFLRGTCGLLLITALVQSAFIAYRGTEVVLVPPSIPEKMSATRHSADANFKKGWASFVASTVGNVSPATVDFVLARLQDTMAPNVYHEFRQQLATQVEQLKVNNLALSYEMSNLFYERETNKVFVSGRMVIRGSGEKLDTQTRVFEVVVDMVGGVPTVTALDAYDGDPHTLAWQQKQADRDARNSKK